MTQQIVIHEGKAYAPVDIGGMFEAYTQVPSAQAAPTMTYKGAKIPISLWKQIVSFFVWSNTERKCETQVRLYIKPTGEWMAWAYPQEENGMSVKELYDHADFAPQRQAIASEGWQEFGSVHHHCSAGAFQSGVDSADEKDKIGIHLTVGNIGSAKHTLHARVTLRNNGVWEQYEKIPLNQWFDVPEEYRSLPATIQCAIMDHLLAEPHSCEFPEQWRTNLKPKAPYVYSGNNFGGSEWQPSGTGKSMVVGGFGRNRLSTAEHRAKVKHDVQELIVDKRIPVEHLSWVFEVGWELYWLHKNCDLTYPEFKALCNEIEQENDLTGEVDEEDQLTPEEREMITQDEELRAMRLAGIVM